MPNQGYSLKLNNIVYTTKTLYKSNCYNDRNLQCNLSSEYIMSILQASKLEPKKEICFCFLDTAFENLILGFNK